MLPQEAKAASRDIKQKTHRAVYNFETVTLCQAISFEIPLVTPLMQEHVLMHYVSQRCILFYRHVKGQFVPLQLHLYTHIQVPNNFSTISYIHMVWMAYLLYTFHQLPSTPLNNAHHERCQLHRVGSSGIHESTRQAAGRC